MRATLNGTLFPDCVFERKLSRSKQIFRFFFFALLCFLHWLSVSSAQAAPSSSILWSPTSLTAEVEPGKEQTFTAILTANKPVKNALLQIDPVLAPFVSVSPTALGNLAKFASVEIQVHFAIPQSVTPGTQSDGSIIVRAGNRSVPDSLPVHIKVLSGPSNHMPVADAGQPQRVPINTEVQLDGSGSSDADGDPLTYHWQLIEKPVDSQADLSDINAVAPFFTADRAGDYQAQLVVNDGQIDSFPDSVTVSTINSKPVADAGPDQTTPIKQEVVLDGNGSSDADGNPLTFLWSLIQKPAGSAATLADGTTTTPSFTPDLHGDYVAELVVNDGTADSDPDRVTVSTINTKPVADAGPDLTGNLGDTLLLDGSGSGDVDGDPLGFTWSLLSKPASSNASLVNDNQMICSVTPDLPGDYVAQLIVNDGHVDSDPDTAMITISVLPPPNNIPQITSTPNTIATVGQLYSYDVEATDSNGDTLAYVLVVSPNGMTIDTATGLIQWAPSVAQQGLNSVTVKVEDDKGGEAQQSFEITVNPADTRVTVPALTGLIRSAAEAAIEDAKLNVGTLSFQHDALVTAGIVLSQTVSSGSLVEPGTPVGLTISLGPDNGLPPDPAVVAPIIDPTVATTTYDSTKFLYSGDNPVQTGVAPDTIEPERAAVIRGRVLNRDNQPLSGVTITVLDHPEYGQTESRVDGMFDMAVNGGGLLTVNYAKSGYLPAQRQVSAQWQEFDLIDDIVLIQLDSQVTPIDLENTTESFQVAQGNPVTDPDGTRKATLLFPQGVQATMTLPDGSTQPLTMLHVRATEYTVGDNGPKAMPGELPPESAYTYAVELSVDEAIVAGATSVNFSQPVPFYVENFLGIPEGFLAPLGFYDRTKGAWIAEPDGKVIKFIGISNGMAELDVDGSGNAADAEALAALGITDAERIKLTTLYSTGQSLWRVQLNHFSPSDINFVQRTAGPPGDAKSPNQPPVIPGGKNTVDNPCKQKGSIIECENQTLGETIGITGTSNYLNYSSDRVSGRTDASTLNISLSGNDIPASLKRILLEISVAGTIFTQTFPAAPNQSYSYTWDGKDAYERIVQGLQPATVKIGYVYDVVYYSARNYTVPTFGGRATTQISTGVQGREEAIIWQTEQTNIGVWEAKTLGLGGWSIDVHHAYDPVGKTLYQGNGVKRSALNENVSVLTALTTENGGVNDIAVSSDGSVYYRYSYFQCYIYKIDKDGNKTIVAGNGSCNGSSGDGGIATNASLSAGGATMTVGFDGALYFEDGSLRIRRVGQDGIINTFAGTGISGYSGDGGPASQAQFAAITGLAFSPDGSLYVMDQGNQRIRKIDPEGIITTVAGNGLSGYVGDGGPAIEASLNAFGSLAVGADGSILFPGYNSQAYPAIRKIDSEGIINSVAGGGSPPDGLGDGGLATQAHINVDRISGIVIGSDGTYYFTDHIRTAGGNDIGRIRRVTPDGIISTVGGGQCYSTSQFGGNGIEIGEGGPATAASVCRPYRIAIGPDRAIYFTQTVVTGCQILYGCGYAGKVNRIGPPLPGFDFGQIALPSEDGSQMYQFNAVGRHLGTFNTLTGTKLFQFDYDTKGHITNITDGDNNVITIERDAVGNPTAIVAPFGQRTALTLDNDGYLASASNPANEAYRMIYTDDGLLTSFEDPKNNISTITYDDKGRLFKDENAAQGSQSLTQTELADGFDVVRTTEENRATSYHVERLLTGDLKRTNLLPDGTQTDSLLKTDGTVQTTEADGTVTTSVEGPDPRFSMLAPITKSLTVNTAGLISTLTTERAVTLADPGNPLSLTSLTDRATLNGRISTSTFDAATKMTTSTSAAGKTATSVIDNLGRITQAQVAGLLGVNTTYDTRGRLASVSQGSSPDDRSVLFSYNDEGYLQTVTDPLQRTVNYEYDLAGRVTRQILPDNREILYGYDKNGNLTSLKPPGRPVHIFNYTKVDLTAEYVPPDVGAGSNSTVYEYNLDKDLKRITRPDGQLIDFIYGTAGRLTTLNLPNGDLGYGYDPTTGKLTQITAPDGTLDYSYNGALLTQTAWMGAVTGNVSFEYDNDFRISSISVNGADPIAFQYDADSLLTAAGSLTLSRSTENGLLTGSAIGNVTDSLSYNGFGEVTGYTAQYSGADLFKTEYSYDKLGRITQKQETVGVVTDTYDYGYDLAGRLIEVKKNAVLQSTYGYDANGNRTHLNGQVIATYDDQDRMQSYNGASYDYTANGELKSKTAGGQTTLYQYDLLGNLRQVTFPDNTTIMYVIDGRNRRIGKKINGTLVQGFLYEDQLKPSAELDGSGNVASRFIYANRANVPDYMIKGGVIYRIITDHLGSPRQVVRVDDGTVVQRMNFDEFGKVIGDTNPGFQPFGFAGGLYDRDTRLVRFGARDYDAQTGRWNAKDPILFGGGSVNLFGYALNNPVGLIDVQGQEAINPIGGDDLAGLVQDFFTWGVQPFSYELQKKQIIDRQERQTPSGTVVHGYIVWSKLSNPDLAMPLDGTFYPSYSEKIPNNEFGNLNVRDRGHQMPPVIRAGHDNAPPNILRDPNREYGFEPITIYGKKPYSRSRNFRASKCPPLL
jgi:RHS repeat-associated protein